MSCFAGLTGLAAPVISGAADRGKGRGRVYANITETAPRLRKAHASVASCLNGSQYTKGHGNLSRLLMGLTRDTIRVIGVVNLLAPPK